MFSTGGGVAKLALAIIIALVSFKIVVAVITGSISILAQAVDSLLDIFAVTMTFLAIRFATKPADEEHPFGHGKVEGIAAVVQGILLFGASGGIIYAAIDRIISGEAIDFAWAGIVVMLVSLVTSMFLSRHLYRVARLTGSIALEANAKNISADIYTTAGVLAGFIIISFTGLNIVDSIIALVVAGFIIRAAIGVLRKSFGELIDVRLPVNEEDIIKSAIMEHNFQLINFHDLRTRKAGSIRYVDLHLTMPKNIRLEEAHRLCDHLEQDIKSKLPDINISIHVEPCTTDECKECEASCTIREKNA